LHSRKPFGDYLSEQFFSFDIRHIHDSHGFVALRPGIASTKIWVLVLVEVQIPIEITFDLEWFKIYFAHR